jgi:hypothetical protein
LFARVAGPSDANRQQDFAACRLGRLGLFAFGLIMALLATFGFLPLFAK